MLAYVIPTRDRADELARTLDTLGRLAPGVPAGGAEVVVVDNASRVPPDPPARLANGLRVTLIRLDENLGAAARNTGAAATDARWLVMLDDDSAPTGGDLAAVLDDAPPDVAAIGGDIYLPDGSRERGGAPEVIVGCGCAIRRDAFLDAGGYDPAFGYYVEEYDLCARFIGAGLRISHTSAVRFEHRKAAANRRFGDILARLVRNNAWTISRYAPPGARDAAIATMLERYRGIAAAERVQGSFEQALEDLHADPVPRGSRALSPAQWARFTGRAAVDHGAAEALRAAGVQRAELVERGKGADVIAESLEHAGVRVVAASAGFAVVGTISPGPARDALARRPDAIAPYRLDGPRRGRAVQPATFTRR